MTQIGVVKKCVDTSDHVFIVTNSPPGWLQSSCCRLMPRLAETLKALNIGIVSARGVFQSQWPANPLAWKKQAFQWISQRLQTKAGASTVLVVVGDSEVEMEAGRSLLQAAQVQNLQQVLLAAPTVAQMEAQLNSLSQLLQSQATKAENSFVHLAKIV